MKVVIIGATGSLGQALAKVEAQQATKHETHIVLIASDRRDLEAMRSDLQIRYKVRVDIHNLDFRDHLSSSKVPLDADRYYFPIGYSTESDTWGISPTQAAQIVMINSTNIATTISTIMAERRKVDIIAFGSIAETRGRSKNVFYAMAKRSLTSLFESLLHTSLQRRRPENSARPYLYQIGYMRSTQSFGKKLLFPVAEPEEVANKVFLDVSSSRPGIRYYPAFWRWICWVLRNLPWFLYRRLNF